MCEVKREAPELMKNSDCFDCLGSRKVYRHNAIKQHEKGQNHAACCMVGTKWCHVNEVSRNKVRRYR